MCFCVEACLFCFHFGGPGGSGCGAGPLTVVGTVGTRAWAAKCAPFWQSAARARPSVLWSSFRSCNFFCTGPVIAPACFSSVASLSSVCGCGRAGLIRSSSAKWFMGPMHALVQCYLCFFGSIYVYNYIYMYVQLRCFFSPLIVIIYLLDCSRFIHVYTFIRWEQPKLLSYRFMTILRTVLFRGPLEPNTGPPPWVMLHTSSQHFYVVCCVCGVA